MDNRITVPTPLFLRALRGEQIERPPVWMMRQAGRYLAEYQAMKSRYTFLQLCENPDLAVEVSMQPVRALAVDAAIIFSDILVPARSLGIEVDFAPGPVIKNPIRAAADIANLHTPRADTTRFVPTAIKQLKEELGRQNTNISVIGFAGAPWTLACYLIEQKPFKHFERTAIIARTDRAALHTLLAKITEVTIDYLLSQIEAGADCVQLFDTWAGNLSAEDYRQFALPYTQEIFAAVRKRGSLGILYLNGCSALLELMAESGAHAVSVDWRVDLPQARARIADDIVIQGNFDPTLLYGTTDAVQEQTRAMVRSVNTRSHYIANLGHGILQTTPRENALAFVNTVKEGWA